MKKLLSLLLCVIFCLGVTSCSALPDEETGSKERTVTEVEDEYFEKVGSCSDLLDEICQSIKDNMSSSSFDSEKSRQEDKIKELDKLDAELKALYEELLPMEDEEMKAQLETFHSAYLDLYQAALFPEGNDAEDGDSYYLSYSSEYLSFLTEQSVITGLRLRRSSK